MSDIRVNSVNTFNTSSVGQTGGSGTTPSNVSNPMVEMVQNHSDQRVPVEEKAKRKRELQALLQQKIQEIIDSSPKSTAQSDRARMTEERKFKADRDKKIEEVKAQFAQLEQNLENLPDEEYNKYFQSAFGMEPDEYRMESEQNPDFKIKSPSVDKIKTTNATLDNKNNHTAEEIQQRQGAVIQKREAENVGVEQGLQDAKDNQGMIRKGCSWFVNHSQLFTDTEDKVLESLGQDKKDIEELKQLAQKGDDIAFNTKYKKMTGVDFKVENFEKMEEAQEKYLKNADTKKLVESTKNLNKKNNNYSLDYFEDKIYDPKNPPEMSPLEKSLFEYFGGKKNSGEAIAKTKEWIRNSSKALGVENADDKTKYETLNKALLDKVEEQKKENPDYAKVKDFKKEYEQSLKDAYGKNIPQEKLNNYVSNVENTYTGLKMAAITVATVATGGAGAALAGINAGTATLGSVAANIATDAAAAAITSFSLTSTEEATDKDGYTVTDFKNNLTEAAITGAGVAGAEAAMVGVAAGAEAIANTKFYRGLSSDQKAIVNSHGIEHGDEFRMRAVLKQPITEYDTPWVIEQRYKNCIAGSLKQSDISDEALKTVKASYQARISEAENGKEFYIITGRGGSGKSTIAEDYLHLDKKCFIADSDKIKPLLPGYEEYGAGYTHSISTKINDIAIEEAISQGKNIAIPTTGYPDYLKELISTAKANGYEVKLIHSNISVDKSIERAITRGIEQNRFVDPAIIQRTTYVDEVLPRFQNDPKITEVFIYDNNGTAPKLIDHITK